jgi:hypothetical protein
VGVIAVTIEEAKQQGYYIDLTQDIDGEVYWALFNEHDKPDPLGGHRVHCEFLRETLDDNNEWHEITEAEAWDSMINWLNLSDEEKRRFR